MATITRNIQSYFDNPAHAGVSEFWFTNDHLQGNGSDQYGFFKEHEANNHAANLKDKGVTRITRAEVEAWAKDNETIGQLDNVAKVDHVVTQEDLDNNPEMVAQGVTVGETIQIPVVASNNVAEEVKAAAKKPVKKVAANKK